MDKPIIHPSQQGTLDSLCGIYSLVNAVAYLYDGRVKRRRLKSALLRAYQSRWDLLELIARGMDQQQMDYLIRRVLMRGFYRNQFPMRVSKPFEERKGLRAKKVMVDISRFLNRAEYIGCRLVLIGTQYHWSLIKHVDETFLYLFDSAGGTKSYRSSYSFRPGHTAYELIPDAIYFFERSLED